MVKKAFNSRLKPQVQDKATLKASWKTSSREKEETLVTTISTPDNQRDWSVDTENGQLTNSYGPKFGLLTYSQTTNVRLYQTERVCR